MGKLAVVVVGGGPLSPHAEQAWQELVDATAEVEVIAADSGLDHAIAAGIEPDRLVGDLDSVSAAGRMWAYAHGVDIDEHPTDKDATDTELALAAAVSDPQLTDLLLLGGLDPLVDDRLDHVLGNLLVLGHPALATFQSVRAIVGASEVVVLHPGGRADLGLDAGQTFSLLALHGPCRGVSVTGARWPLSGAELTGYEARGLSNVSDGSTIVGVAEGVLTVVIP
ncbi:MAG TPA: thiamine diphosphokinase [Ilumatobacteraceae bacterium]|nr:thiamine diphosphokinase [Ilumatobacteraceae bacterium]